MNTDAKCYILRNVQGVSLLQFDNMSGQLVGQEKEEQYGKFTFDGDDKVRKGGGGGGGMV